MNFEIAEKEKMSLAFLYGAIEDEVEVRLDQFLNTNGIVESKRYFLEMVVTQGSKKTITYIKYATVPEQTQGTKEIKVIHMAQGKYLFFRNNESQFLDFKDGQYKQAIEAFLKAQNLKMDMSKVFFLVEKVLDETVIFYDIFAPVKI